jgi:hypothetical protein
MSNVPYPKHARLFVRATARTRSSEPKPLAAHNSENVLGCVASEYQFL